MEREFDIAGKRVKMRASALIPRMYRHAFGRDMVADMRKLQKAYSAAQKAQEAGASEEEAQDSNLALVDLEIFENVSWIMMKHAAEFRDVVTGQDENGADVIERQLMSGDMVVGRTPEEWLDSLDGVFSVYEVLPVILELWGANMKTTSVPAKK